jgi:hypothetical protein
MALAWMRFAFFPLVGLTAICVPAFADEKKTTEPAESQAARLVRWLGSPEFRDREAANVKLLALGTKAKPAILAGAQGPDAEVANRCVAILKQFRMTEREALFAGNGVWSSDLGKRFKELAGDTVESQRLFAAMTADEQQEQLLESAAKNPNEAAQHYVYKLTQVERGGSNVFEAFTGGLAEPEIWAKYRDAHKDAVPLAELAAILFLGSFSLPERVKDPPQVQQLLRNTFVESVKGPFREPLRKLFVAWLEQRREPEAVVAGLKASLYGSIPGAAPFARRLIREPTTAPSVIGAALEVIGNYGSKDDLLRLAKFRNDARQVRKLAGAKEGEYEIQVRDLVASMSAQLCRCRFGFGFHWTSWVGHWYGSGRPVFDSIEPFHKNAHREKAISSAWNWLDALPKDETNG